MSKSQGWIYKIENKANGKIYVGQTIQSPKVRWQDGHRNRLRKKKHYNDHLQAAWNKYGEDSFTFEVIEQFDPEMNFDLNNLEKYWIKTLDSKNPNKGYNMTEGGDGSGSPRLETREKISKACKKAFLENPQAHFKRGFTPWNKGIPMSEKQKKVHSLRLKGKTAWNKGLKGHEAWNKGLLGCFSDETIRKMSEQKKGKPGANKGFSKFKVILKNIETGELVVFDSIYKCAEAIGSKYSTIKTHIKREAELLMKKYQIRNFIPGGVPLAA
jgi:group I intron endonuclease